MPTGSAATPGKGAETRRRSASPTASAGTTTVKPRQGRTASGRRFTGAPQQIADDIKAYEELGVSHISVGLQAGTLAETMDRLERFATVVKPMAP